MPGSTSRLALPYPVPSDTADVPRDVQALATKLDTDVASLTDLSAATPTFIDAGQPLPASPVDGQEVYYVANAALGCVWHLRYNAGSASAYKWEFVGGAPLFAGPTPVTNRNVTNTAYAAIADTPSLTVPRAGDYTISVGGLLLGPGSLNAVYVSYTVGAVAANDGWGCALGIAQASASLSASKWHTGVAAGAVVAERARVTGGTGQISVRWLQIQPYRVS